MSANRGRVRAKDDDQLFELFATVPFAVPVVLAGVVWLLFWRLMPGSGGSVGILPAMGIVFMGIAAAIERRGRARAAAAVRGLDDLRSLSWRQFEEVVAEAFRQRGYLVQPTARGVDGGVDLIVRRNGETALVQCKRWKQRQVPVMTVRELLGVMTAERANAGFVVSCGQFSPEAQAFARGKPITLMNGSALLAFLGRQPETLATVATTAPHAMTTAPEQPVAPAPEAPGLSAVAPPSCPRCGKLMVLRTGRFGAFYGCTRYPRCHGTQPAA